MTTLTTTPSTWTNPATVRSSGPGLANAVVAQLHAAHCARQKAFNAPRSGPRPCSHPARHALPLARRDEPLGPPVPDEIHAAEAQRLREANPALAGLSRNQIGRHAVRFAAEHFAVPVNDLLSRRRARTITRPRQIAMLVVHERTSLSLPQIGRLFDRDHTTVLHGIDRAKHLIDQSDEYLVAYDAIHHNIDLLLGDLT
ncbi:hypothetical protein L1787_13025 [Acuticoccus sp. M5D2P5]|uniref:helix-turn-helix domain-containing protein n=1 Tax=Acuticoccus kalidii TaxID=2910977 RepID=UPI001F328D80|nr:helix-turn-helix domain-containing protein [Acuticoccus kalidii]MCF3934332.1 hypothetical protein [Acuticoccus kalidii]